MRISVDLKDLEEIYDALWGSNEFFRARDEMNASVHMADVRYSPLTIKVEQELDRLSRIIGDGEEVEE